MRHFLPDLRGRSIRAVIKMKLKDICSLFIDGDWIETKDQSDYGIRLIQTGNIGEGIFLEKRGKEKYIYRNI